MKICLVCEGCYPYVAGGVSSWVQGMIKAMPQHEFIIWAIGANESMKGQFVYELPENITEVHEVFLDSMLSTRRTQKSVITLTDEETVQIYKMLTCEDPDWDIIFDMFKEGGIDPIDFLLDPSFLRILKAVCAEKYPHLPFTDYFWTVRSMFLPLLYLIHSELPEADLYHSCSCGYAGMLAAAAAKHYDKPYMLTEHGIYTREREEEILRAGWVAPMFKILWIELFYMFTRCAYNTADVVTSLFNYASHAQRELGCDGKKQLVVPNGVNTDLFSAVPPKKPDGYIDIGAVVRIAPIKDIKTMIYAFARVEQENDRIRLHIIGPTEENPEYYQECVTLLEELGLKNAFFTGRVNTAEYLEKIDFTLLSSISEGMPLATLESMAAGRPAITTNVGCCSELLFGTGDNFGEAGICVPAMHPKQLADAILRMASDPARIERMGRNGKKRVLAYFRHPDMIQKYLDAYDKTIENYNIRKETQWQESDSN